MSNYGAPSQYDDAELERQLQEEYRRRQAMQGGGPSNGQIMHGRQPEPYGQHQFPMMQHQHREHSPSPYGYSGAPGPSGGHPHHPSPYTQLTNPYGGIADARAAYAQRGAGGSGATPPQDPAAVAQMYAAQQRRAQIAGSYGYSGTGPAQGSRSSIDPQYGGYGMAPTGYPPPRDYSQSSPHDMHSNMDPYASLKPKQISRSPVEEMNNESPVSATISNAEPTSLPANKNQGTAGKMKKPMLQKVTTTINKPKSTARVIVKDGTTIIEDGESTWYTGCVPLGLDDDKYWLSELQVYLRSHFAEAFGATEEDIAAPMHGRNKPIALGQVGIRCMHCKHDNPAERGQQATSYPSLISGIYNSVQQMLRLHLDCCLSMPPEVRSKIDQLKLSCSSRGGRKQYWIDSAKRLGLVDTPHGIHFGRDPLGPLPPLSGPSVNSKEGRTKKKATAKENPSQQDEDDEKGDKEKQLDEPERSPSPPIPTVDDRPLVFPEDKPLISDYLYLTLEQMAPCCLTEADRVGCYKTRKVGFPGLACRHCVGQAGCGRYFPASEASLSQTTTSQTIMNHVRNCRRCPIEIRENLEIMKRNRMGPDGKRSDKPKHGGRKVFFHRLWCRIQDIPLDEADEEKIRNSKKKKPTSARKKKKAEESDGSDEEKDQSDDETESDNSDEEGKPKAKRRPSTGKKVDPWVEGCVRLTKTDDAHWLSEMECFARKDLIEAFSAKEEDLSVYGGRKEPSVGQVGIRCIFCKTLETSERPNNYMGFPESLSTLHSKVSDMIRLHFPSCPAMPDDARATFKSYKGFDAKVANDDSQQYWVDSARDIGLSNIPPQQNVGGAWGITFRRDPLQPSPADELDLEQNNDSPVDFGKNSLLTEEDRGGCTDQVMLLLRQVRPCQFKKSDKRSGPGSRGRDRANGFPGLACMHCAGKKTSLGRYFPVSAKNLTDSTANSLAAHVASCSFCPEPIKASLAYLGHRSILQKAELSGSWKKTFFKKIWDRLHVDRTWTSIDEEIGDNDDGSFSGEEAPAGDDDEEVKEGENEDDEASGSDKEEMGNQMNALIKAAAIWLTNQDAASDKGGRKSRAQGKRTAAPASPAAAGAKTETPDAEAEEDDGERKTRSAQSNKKRRTRK